MSLIKKDKITWQCYQKLSNFLGFKYGDKSLKFADNWKSFENCKLTGNNHSAMSSKVEDDEYLCQYISMTMIHEYLWYMNIYDKWLSMITEYILWYMNIYDTWLSMILGGQLHWDVKWQDCQSEQKVRIWFAGKIYYETYNLGIVLANIIIIQIWERRDNSIQLVQRNIWEHERKRRHEKDC